jgi:hypothetical protein
LGENLGEVGEFGDVADEPKKIVVQKHNFPPMFVQGPEARLVVKMVGIDDAGR